MFKKSRQQDSDEISYLFFNKHISILQILPIYNYFLVGYHTSQHPEQNWFQIWQIFKTFSIRRYFFRLVSFMYRKNQHVLISRHQTSLEFLPYHVLAKSKAIFTKSKAAAILFTPLKTAALIYRFHIWFNYMCMVPFFVKSSKNSNYIRRLLKSTFRGVLD